MSTLTTGCRRSALARTWPLQVMTVGDNSVHVVSGDLGARILSAGFAAGTIHKCAGPASKCASSDGESTSLDGSSSCRSQERDS